MAKSTDVNWLANEDISDPVEDRTLCERSKEEIDRLWQEIELRDAEIARLANELRMQQYENRKISAKFDEIVRCVHLCLPSFSYEILVIKINDAVSRAPRSFFFH